MKPRSLKKSSRRQKKRPRKPARDARLANAPLAEVVFELRWELQRGPLPGPTDFDPMLVPLLANFSAAMDAAGFPRSQDFSHPQQTGPYGVVRRFFKDTESPFPIMQIGAGIFATNESAQYEWKTFKAQVLFGLKVLLKCYPIKYGFSLRPNYLELRYIDVFDKTVLGSSGIFQFTETGTSLKFELPQMLDDKGVFWGNPSGRFSFARGLRERKDSVFSVDLATGRNNDTKEDVIRMESKVTSSGRGVPVLNTDRAFIAQMGKWLEYSHGITSPFFKDFILPDVMKKFRGK
jgi:uncharacterized protein (TIGR04255 family)